MHINYFTNVKFDVAICLNGELPDRSIFTKILPVPIYCADGSANYLFDIGIIPEKVVGDLDSLDYSKIPENFNKENIIHYTSQEDNDFEKILSFITEHHDCQNILIFGIHGGEMEHSLNNLSVFKKFSKKFNFCIYEKDRFCLMIDESIGYNSEINEVISIIPFNESIITTDGLRWNLNNEELKIGNREGARNIADQNEINIKLHSGMYLFFIDSSLPNTPKVYKLNN